MYIYVRMDDLIPHHKSMPQCYCESTSCSFYIKEGNGIETSLERIDPKLGCFASTLYKHEALGLSISIRQFAQDETLSEISNDLLAEDHSKSVYGLRTSIRQIAQDET